MDNQANERFFKDMGSRIALFRKKAGLTQQQLGEILGLKQQLIAAYEKGTRRIPASFLEALSKALYISVEEILGIDHSESKKRGPVPIIQKKMEQIEQLPPSERKSLLNTIDNYLKANQT